MCRLGTPSPAAAQHIYVAEQEGSFTQLNKEVDRLVALSRRSPQRTVSGLRHLEEKAMVVSTSQANC